MNVGVMMGADLAERFRQAGLEAAGQRRRVTILFADLVGFTTLSQLADTEDTYLLIQQVMNVLAQAVYQYDGMVDKFIGDGLMAIFGAPIAHENSAELAIRSALAMHGEMARLSQEMESRFASGRPPSGQKLALHIGLHTGPVIVGGIGSSLMMNYTAIGDTVNLAARLQQVCPAGDILVSEAAYAAAHPLFEFEPLPAVELKGYTRPVPAYRVLSEKAQPGRLRGIEGLHAPLTGREEEFRQLVKAGSRLIENASGGVAWIEGEAGIGKSRLTDELTASLDPRRVRLLAGHCLLYRRAAAYWPFLDLLRDSLGLPGGLTSGSAGGQAGLDAPGSSPAQASEETLQARLGRAVTELLGDKARETLPFLEIFFSLSPSNPEDSRRVSLFDAAQLQRHVFLAIRDWLQAHARRAPLLLVLEDLHWADDTSLDLLAYLVPALQHDPVLWLLISRPDREGPLGPLVEGLKRRMGGSFLELRLQNLTPDQSHTLVSQLLSLPEKEAGLFAPVIQRAGGNPFYLEELIRMLIDARLLARQGQAWQLQPGAEGHLRGVPDTLQGLILARFDHLSEQPRRILQAAAVVGRSFEAGLLGDVLEGIERPALHGDLASLAEREFIVPVIGPLSGPLPGPLSGTAGDRYQFKHVLVSDAIYNTLLRADRRRLHTRVGEALERLYAGRFEEHAELLARHFGDGTRPERALHYNLMAGQKSLRGSANLQARRYFEAALDLLGKIPSQPEQFQQAHTGFGDVQVLAGDYNDARQHYLLALANQMAPGGGEAPAAAGPALDSSDGTGVPAGDPAGEPVGGLVESLSRVTMEDPSAWLRVSRLCRKISSTYERQGNYDRAAQVLALAHQAVSKVDGDGKAANPEGVSPQAATLQGPARQESDVEQGWILNDTGWIHSRRGDLQAAETSLLQALELVADSGQYDLIASIYNRLGGVCYQTDRLDQAAGYVQQSLLLRQKIGDINAVARSYNNLGLLGWKRGEWDDALANFRKSVELHGTLGDVEGTIELHSNLGLLHLDRGDYAEARAHLEQALESAGQIGHAYQAGLALLHFSRLNVLQEDWQAALDFSQRAQAVFQEIGASEHHIDLLTYAGLAHLGLGRIDLAESAAAQALQPGAAGGQPEPTEDVGRALRLAGQIALHQGDLGSARHTFETSYQIFQNVGNLIEQGRTGCALAEVLAACQDEPGARDMLLQAREIFSKLGANPDLKRVEGLLEKFC